MTTGRRVVTARSLVETAELPEHEAGRLLQVATGLSRSELVRSEDIDATKAEAYELLVARRRSGEPLQYLEGTSQFGPVEVAIDGRVLIPRPETEELWELTVQRLERTPPGIVVDLGTGSGNIALALKAAFPAAAVHAVELSAQASAVAARNILAAHADVSLHRGDLFAALPDSLRGRVDLVVSNPPYVAGADYASLPAEVRDYEPAVALFGGDDGLAVLRRIIAAAPDWISPGGWLVCEIGADQGDAVLDMAGGFDAEVVADAAGRDRFLFAQKGNM